MVVPRNTNFYQAAIVDRLPLGYTLPSPLNPTVTCVVETVATPCSLDSAAVLGPEDDLTPSAPLRPAQVLAFYFGDVLSSPDARIVTITYKATVADIATNVDNVDLVNAAQARWDLVDSMTDPDSPLYPWTESGNSNDASVEILEPRLTIQKTTPDLTIEPGQEFDYSIVVTNTGRGPAFNRVVRDTISAGIVLVPAQRHRTRVA